MNLHRLATRYGPWAVVTGASSGIGLSIARLLAASGLNLVLIGRHRTSLEKFAEDLFFRHRIETLVVTADLSDPGGVTRVMAQTEHLDVGLFVASAGFGTSGDVVDTDLATELNMINVNCGALFAASQHFARRLSRRGRGGIILLSSLVAFQGVARSANYAATKAYVQTLAEGLNRELKAFGVDVLASAPGPVDTGFAHRAGMHMNGMAKPEDVARETLLALGRRMTVRPTWRNKLLQAALAPLPRPMRARILQQVMSGMVPASRTAVQPE
ncbi:MAG: SDR family NAD(P)-dependent oxidoreductase [Wenzhouxiangella sp.]